MLILKKIGIETEGIWKEYELDGDVIPIKIRPLSSDIFDRIQKRARRNGKSENDLLLDHIVEDFKNVVGEDGNPVPVTLTAKKALLDAFLVERPGFVEELIETARKMAYAIAKEQEKK